MIKVGKSKSEPNSKQILENLIQIVSKCQSKYGLKKEIATEKDPIVVKLCDIWVETLTNGLKNPQNSFWTIIEKNLSSDEKNRFCNFKNDKVRIFICVALNEKTLERYVLLWLSDPDLEKLYESWALLRDIEALNLLPSCAAGLKPILFAIDIEFIYHTNQNLTQNQINEPIIHAPKPITSSKKCSQVKRRIESFEDITINKEEQKTEVEKEKYGIHSKEIHQICTQLEFEPNKNIENENIESLNNHESFTEGSLSISNQSCSECSLNEAGSSSVKQVEEKNVEWMIERLAHLETCVAVLSQENRRLREQLSFLSVSISIPTYILQQKGNKSFYLYEINIIMKKDAEEWSVFKRYSELYKMHKEMQEKYVAVRALNFPPKKKIGSMKESFVEERRRHLQDYLKHLVTVIPEISSSNSREELQLYFPFFK